MSEELKPKKLSWKKLLLFGCLGMTAFMIGLTVLAGFIGYYATTPEYQAAQKKQQAEEAQKLAQEKKAVEIKEKQNKAAIKQYDSIITEFQKSGYLSELDCELSSAHVNPIIWHSSDLRTKEKSTFVLMKYCALKGGAEEIFTIRNMMDGKELGGYGVLGFQVK